MEIKTDYPVYVDGKRIGSENNEFYYTNGPEPTDQEKETKARAGQVWDKVSGKWREMTQNERSLFNRLKSSGAFGALGQLLGIGQTPAMGTPTTTVVEEEKPKKKISTTTWVLIGVGVLALGGIVYFATRDKK
jgi:hypothetical protein